MSVKEGEERRGEERRGPLIIVVFIFISVPTPPSSPATAGL